MRGISWLSEDLLASQEGLCCMDLITSYCKVSIIFSLPLISVLSLTRIAATTDCFPQSTWSFMLKFGKIYTRIPRAYLSTTLSKFIFVSGRMAPYLNNRGTRWRWLISFVAPTALSLTQRATIPCETRGYHSGIAQDPKCSAILRRVTDFSEGPNTSIVRVNQSDVLGLPESEDEGNPSISVPVNTAYLLRRLRSNKRYCRPPEKVLALYIRRQHRTAVWNG